MTKKQRGPNGGARPGAGRKSDPASLTATVIFKVHPDVEHRLYEMAAKDESANLVARRIIIAALGMERNGYGKD